MGRLNKPDRSKPWQSSGLKKGSIVGSGLEVRSFLGKGAFGAVYRVKRQADGQSYALKIVDIRNRSQRGKQGAVNEIRVLAAVQSEYSLLDRDEAEQIRAATSELGITFVAYSPLGRGLLTDNYINAETVSEDDPHFRHPRFSQGNFQQNRELALRVAEFAAQKKCTPAQLVLAWLLGQGDDVVAIPGTKRASRFDENMGALDVSLSADELTAISAAVPVGAAAGTRYPDAQMKKVFVDSAAN